jgi:hypothetical protein
VQNNTTSARGKLIPAVCAAAVVAALVGLPDAAASLAHGAGSPGARITTIDASSQIGDGDDGGGSWSGGHEILPPSF